MTIGEFRAWAGITAISRDAWIRDVIQFHNHKRMLFYRGGKKGIYIEIDKTGELIMGVYEDAIPHIGEASFKIQHRKIFNSQEEALQRVQYALGADFFIEL